MQDMLNREIKPFDIVVNCGRRSSSVWMTVHKVLKVIDLGTDYWGRPRQKLQTRVIVNRFGQKNTGKKATIFVGRNCLIIGGLASETDANVPEESFNLGPDLSDICAAEAGRDPLPDPRWEGIVAQLEANSQSSDKGVFEGLAHRT